MSDLEFGFYSELNAILTSKSYVGALEQTKMEACRRELSSHCLMFYSFFGTMGEEAVVKKLSLLEQWELSKLYTAFTDCGHIDLARELKGLIIKSCTFIGEYLNAKTL